VNRGEQRTPIKASTRRPVLGRRLVKARVDPDWETIHGKTPRGNATIEDCEDAKVLFGVILPD
jgi:hypothetical protein